MSTFIKVKPKLLPFFNEWKSIEWLANAFVSLVEVSNIENISCSKEDCRKEDSSGLKTERSSYLSNESASREYDIKSIDLFFESVNCADSVLSPGCFYLILTSKVCWFVFLASNRLGESEYRQELDRWVSPNSRTNSFLNILSQDNSFSGKS